MNDQELEAFFRIHQRIPREGPGSDESTHRALRLLPELPPRARVLDLGCGPGRQTLVLARELRTSITAIDLHQPFLDALRESALQLGLSTLVETRRISMDALDYPVESIDLIWSEGAAYCVGLERALRLWRPLLKPGGLLAFTEATWFTDDPAPEVAAWWSSEYPAIATTAANEHKARAAGYDILNTFPLPAADWWQEYYGPLQKRVDELRVEGDKWPELRQAIAETEKEISMFTRFGESYGYVFYILQKPSR